MSYIPKDNVLIKPDTAVCDVEAIYPDIRAPILLGYQKTFLLYASNYMWSYVLFYLILN